MMPKEKHSELGYPEIDSQLTRMKGPVLIVSTVVGRGMQSLGKAIEERFAKSGRSDVRHVAIEEIVSPAVVREDLKRYQWISSRFPILLNLVYRIPFFYHRKYLRERWIREADHSGIARELGSSRPATVICVSHRPCFWMSSYKWRNESGFELWGLLGEYGNNLGWRYQFWPQVDGYFSPVSRESLDTPFPETLQFENIVLPARQVYLELSASPGDPDQILLVCGYWGQGPFRKIIRELTRCHPKLVLHVVFGDNARGAQTARAEWKGAPTIRIHEALGSLADLVSRCGAVITKPGIATLVESHAAGRKIFLVRGMPVAEDNNAEFAVRKMGAEWFNRANFERWHKSQAR